MSKASISASITTSTERRWAISISASTPPTLDKFFQETSPQGDITAAQAAGDIPALIAVGGEASLVRDFGRPEWRWTTR